MRTIILMVVCMYLAASAAADDFKDGAFDCFDRVAKNAHSQDTITIFTRDNAIILGCQPIFKISSTTLYVRSVKDTGTDYVVIPTDKIDHITYRKPSWMRWGLTIGGLVIGATAGAIVGVAAAPEPDRWLDFPEIETGILGGTIGGLIGLVCGHTIGKHFTTTVTVRCGS